MSLPTALPTRVSAVPVTDRLCMWSGVAMCVFIGIGFLVGGLIPPPHPAGTAADIGAFYANHVDRRRAGIIVMSIGAMFMIPFGVAIAGEMRRILGRPSTMASLQVGASAFLATTTTIYLFILLTLTFRTDRPTDLTLLLNDLVWVPFVGMWQPGALQALAVAGVVFTDPHSTQTGHWPRWVGWVSLWYAFTSLVALFVPFFHYGPFSWAGLFPFYIGAVALLGWWMVMATVMLRSTRNIKGEKPS